MKIAEDLRRAVLQAAIEGKLTGSNTENWQFVRLREIVGKKIKRGKSPKYASHSNILVFAQKCNAKSGKIDLSLARYLYEATIGKYPEEEFMTDGDIVLNSTGRGTLGRVGQYRLTDNPQNIPLVPDSHVTIIRPMQNISSEYIYYVLKHYQPYIETLGEGSTNQTELSAKKVANLTIPLPLLDEQRRIVSRLDTILPQIAELESVENELETLNKKFPCDMRDALLQAAIEGRLTGGNTDNWRWVRLGEVGRWQSGATPSKTRPEFYGGNIPWLVTGDLNDDFIDENDITHRITEIALAETSVKMNPRGSVLIAMYGATIGKTGILNVDATTNQACCACLPFEGIYNKYLFWVLRALKQTFINMAAGGAQPNISKEKIIRTIIPLPPLDEQHKIVSRLNELLPLCEALEKVT